MAGAPKKMTEDTLDDILDRALDDFDEEEEVLAAAALEESARRAAGGGGTSAAVAAAAAASSAATTAGTEEDATELSERMSKLMADMSKPEFRSTLDATMRELSGGGTTAGTASVVNPFAGLPQGVGAPPMEQTDRTVAETLSLLAGASREQEGVDPATAEAMGEEVMKKMMGEFEKMGEKEDFQSVIDNMMKQLLSKDIMYLPMKQICDKFPEWLADNESKLPADDYERFGRQYQYFQRLVAVYETEPDNFPRLMELMQDMQETGQPPAEIIKELAPGLNFSEDGMPMLPNMGAGVPTMGGMPGACSIM